MVFFKINLFIYFWLCWVFVAVCGLPLVAASGGHSSLRCAGFALRWLLPLRTTDSRHLGFCSCGLRALECRLSSCDARAQLLRSIWDPSGPGLEPMSPALAGGLPTTAPSGKFLYWCFDSISIWPAFLTIFQYVTKLPIDCNMDMVHVLLKLKVQ